MKGVVFKEFISLVENKFGEEIAESMIQNSKVASGGAYASVGNYDHSEMISMVQELSRMTTLPADQLLKTFGHHLAATFARMHPDFFHSANAFVFLKSVESMIHVEVRKLYPGAELPSFQYAEPSADELHMTYTSKRPFSDLAEGLIEAVIKHYKEPISIGTRPHPQGEAAGRVFMLKRKT